MNNINEQKGSVAQYDGFSAGEFHSSVNLFRGETMFDYPLVTGIPKKNGIGIQISATYSSNTDRKSRTDNVNEPCGILGLGWNLGYSVISRENSDVIQPPERSRFFYSGIDGGVCQLYHTDYKWIVAVLKDECAEEIQKESVSEYLSQLLAEQGVAVTEGSKIEKDGERFVIIDEVKRFELAVELKQNDEYEVYYHGINFEPANYDFSKIVYFPRFEVWYVTDKQGIRRVYGGTGETGELQYIVHYHGLVLSSANGKDQERAVVAWNLSREETVWGNHVSYRYCQGMGYASKNGLQYTRECYLSEIVDSYGFSSKFEYEKKNYGPDCKEYINPNHPYDSNPIKDVDCDQPRFETNYLSSITTYGPDKELIETILFHYDVKTLFGSSKTAGRTAKRLLMSIERKLAKGGCVPPCEFTYETEQQNNLGALKSVLTPAGTKVDYQYTKKQLPQCNSRKYVISTEQFAEQKIWNGNQFSAILLYNEYRSKFEIYQWVGRFQKWLPDSKLSREWTESTEAIPLQNSIVLYDRQPAYHNTQIVWYRQNPDVIGGWKTEVCDSSVSEHCLVYAQDNWLVVIDQKNSKMIRYTYDLLHRTTNKVEQSLNPRHSYQVAANGFDYALLDYDIQGVQGYKKSKLSTFCLNGYGKWVQTAEIELPQNVILYNDAEKKLAAALTYSGKICALANVNRSDTTAYYYDLHVWMVSDSFSKLFEKSYVMNCNMSVWEDHYNLWHPVVDGNMILTGGSLLVYDGSKVHENNSLSIDQFDLSQGVVLHAFEKNCLIQSCIKDGTQKEVLAQVLLYKPEKNENFETLRPIRLYHENPEEIDTTRYVPTITGHIATFDRYVYDLFDQDPFQRVFAELPLCQSASVLNMGDSILYKDDQGFSKYLRIVNGEASQQVNNLEGSLPDFPEGSNVFTTKQDQSIMIYVNTGDSYEDSVSNYQTSSIMADDGFVKSGKLYNYSNDKAVCDVSGIFAKYYEVDVYQSGNIDKGYTRYLYCNSLANVLPEENVRDEFSLDGQLLGTSVCDKNGQVLSKTEFQYSIVRKVAEAPEAERTRAIYGTVMESMTVKTEQDSTESVNTTVMDGFSGEKRETIVSSYDVFGNKITSKQTVKPAASDYSVLMYQNRLAETGETKDEWSQNDEGLQTVQVKRRDYSAFEGRTGNVLIPTRQLLWKGVDCNENWSIQHQVQMVSLDGDVIQQKMQSDIIDSKLYSSNGLYEIGSLTNTEIQSDQYFICSFESYETIPEVWISHVTNEMSVAGYSSLKIRGCERISGFKRMLDPGEYMLSYWCIGDTSLEISGEAIFVSEDLVKEWNGWKNHILKVIVREKQNAEISFVNDSREDAYIDILCIAPFFYPPMVQVYKGRFLDACVSSYGKMARQIYDRRNYAIGTMDEKLCSLTIPFYRRNACYHAPENVLNSELSLRLSGNVFYERNERESIHACLENPTKTTLSSAIYVDVRGNEETHLTLGNVEVSYVNNSWNLIVDGNSRKLAGLGCDGEWLLIVGRKVLFFFNGENLFSADSNTQLDEINLALTGKAVYSNIVYGTGASFGVQYLNSAGKVQQGQMYQEDEVTITQYFYDDENRVIAQTKPAVFKDLSYGYQERFAVLDTVTKKMTGMIADAYPEDEGFPYVGQTYEDTPLGRITESGLPGADLSINPAIEKQNRRTTKVSYDPVEIAGLSLKKENYFYQVTQSPDGKKTVSILNTQKQQVASAALGESSAIVSATCNAYQGTMRVQHDYLPAYFDGNELAVRTKWFDYSGNLVAQKNPEQDDEFRYAYNDKKEKRFIQTPEMKKQGKTLYQKYNDFHCLIEEGICTIPWEELVVHVNEAEYPNCDTRVMRTYEYGTSLSESGSILNPIKVCVFAENGTEGVTEFYKYDDDGRVTTKSIQIPGIENVFTEQCHYDNQDQVVSVKNTSGQQSDFIYDASGRMKEEVLADGKRKTEFSYTANDMLCEAKTEDGSTRYQYTSAGWIKEIQSPLLHEIIQYDGARIKEFTVELKKDVDGVPKSVRYLVEYDEFGRLRSAECYDGDRYLEEISIHELKYDHSGNILSMNMGDRIKEYIYQKNSNKLDRVGDDEFKYDADGSVTSATGKKIREIRYEFGKPVFVQTEDASFNLLYDTSGNRVLKTGSDKDKTVYLYRKNRLSEKIHIPDDRRDQYLYGQFGLRTIIGKDKIQDVATDHLGSPHVISEHGNAVAISHYTPFGKELPVEGEMEFGFNGFGKEQETGLYYSAYRFYDPETGRFYSVDPKESSDSPYCFCGNDPINRIDPKGDSWWGVLLGAVVGVIGTVATVLTMGAACPALVAADASIAASFFVNATAGVVGSVAGNLVTAACDKEPITAKMVLGSVAQGVVLGFGALAGPAEQGAVKLVGKIAGDVCNSVKIACKVAANCTVNAATGVAGTLTYDGVTDTPISADSVITSAFAGIGAGLLTSYFVGDTFKPDTHGTMAAAQNGDTGHGGGGGDPTLPSGNVGEETLNPHVANDANLGMGGGNFPPADNVVHNQDLLRVNPEMNDAFTVESPSASHGIGSHSFSETVNGTRFAEDSTRIVRSRSFSYGDSFAGKRSVKFASCYSCGELMSRSAKGFASALEKSAYAFRRCSSELC